MSGPPRTAPLALAVVLALLVAPLGTGVAAATPPSVPAAYYGTLTVDGEPAPEGVTVTARVDGEVRDTITTGADGSFGGAGAFDAKLEVDADRGDTVSFWVDGEPTGTHVEYDSGSNRRVDIALDSLPGDDGNDGNDGNDGDGGDGDPGDGNDGNAGEGDGNDGDAGNGNDGDAGNGNDGDAGPGNDGDNGAGDPGDPDGGPDSARDVVDAVVTAGDDGSVVVEAAAEADETVRVDVPDAAATGGDVALEALEVSVTEDAALYLDVSVTAEPPARISPPGDDVVAYVNVSESSPEETFGEVEFSFTVAKSALEDPESAVLYRLHDGEWSALETEFVGAEGDVYRFTATSPGLSVFAVREGSPSLSVTDASVESSSVTVGETTTVTATVENAGSGAGEMDVSLTVDGASVATKTVSVPADGATTVSFEHAFEETGTVSVAVEGVEAGQVDVVARSSETDSPTASATDADADVDGQQQIDETPVEEQQGLEFGPLGILAAGVVLLAVFAAFRYQQR